MSREYCMKKLMKKIIHKIPILRKLIFGWGIGIQIPISRIFVNYAAKIIFAQNFLCKYPVHYTSKIVCPANLVLEGNGKGTVSSLAVSGGCYLQAGNGIIIGEGTIWAPNVVIVSANHDLDNKNKSWNKGSPVKIGKNCWIGANSVILPHVTLGDNTIVGAGAVVTKSFPDGNITLVGNPARQTPPLHQGIDSPIT